MPLTAGGGIHNAGTATLTNCTLSGNSASDDSFGTSAGGGIYNTGTVTLTNCTLSGNSVGRTGFGIFGDGGGIYNAGTATLSNCTLSGNSIGDLHDTHEARGGGIHNAGTVTLSSCTLSGNSVKDRLSSRGGGIYNAGTATLTNCTVSGNSAVCRFNCADAYAGGIYNAGMTTLTNTIIANSPQGRTCAADDGVPPVVSKGHNLDDDGGCGLSGAGDLTSVPAQLAPLGDYGGPTQTHALCTGPGTPAPSCIAASRAIDAGGNANCPATDQRGAPRPHGSRCDIGAYESGAQPPGAGACVGNCINDSSVTVDEILTMVNIAIGNANASTCSAGDADHDGQITIDEILAAVNNALNGCST